MEQDDNRLSNFVMLGFGAIVVGTGMFLVGIITSAVLAGVGAGLFVLGVLSAGGATIYGLNQTKKAETTDEVVAIPDVYVVARFAINEIGETIFSDFDPEESQMFVRIKLSSGRSNEYRTAYPVWASAPEGAKGIAYVQGDWLARFELTARSP